MSIERKPWTVVVWEQHPTGPGGAGRMMRRGAAVFRSYEAANRWVGERRANDRGFRVKDVIDGDPRPMGGGETDFDVASDIVHVENET